MSPLKGDAVIRYNSVQGANLLTFPSSFDNAVWSKTRVTVTADATTDPDGTTTADKIVEDTTASSTHLVSRSDKGVDNVETTFAVYAKPAGRDYVHLQAWDAATNTSFMRARFDLASSTVATDVTGNGTITSASIDTLSDGWRRCVLTGVTDTSGAGGNILCQVRMATGTAAGDAAYTGDGTSGVYLWRASLTEVTQVEVALEHPLFRITPAASRVRYEAWSLDRTAREVVTIGDGVKEINGTVRFHADPIEMLAMLEAGANGTELTYFPSLAANVGYPCQLVEPSGEYIETLRDSSSLGKIGRYEVPVRLRRTDGGTWENLF